MSVITEKKGSAFYIKFDNAKRKNCITPKMYADIISAMDEANEDPDTFLTIFTGVGDEFYSSGNDFNPANLAMFDDKNYENPYKRWVDRLIVHKKALVALVNGPAIGIACTTLSLMDMVIASDKAYFLCPFTEMGLVPEGTSSYTFPKMMGHTKAASLALFAEKMTAAEAYTCGFVTKVFPHASFNAETEKLIARYGKLARHSVLKSKELLRPKAEQNRLLTANRVEYEELNVIMESEETVNRIMAKFAPKPKSKI